jgi:hypothetical protein
MIAVPKACQVAEDKVIGTMPMMVQNEVMKIASNRDFARVDDGIAEFNAVV